MIKELFEEVCDNVAGVLYIDFKKLSRINNTAFKEIFGCLNWMAEGKLDAAPMISDRISLDELPDVYQNRIHTGQANKVMLQIGEEF